MKKLNDEEIQKMLEGDFNPEEDALLAFEKDDDVIQYQSLFKKLNTEPAQGPSYNFATKVSAQLRLKLKRRSDLRFNLLAALGMILGLAVAYGLLTIVNFDAGQQFLLVALKYKGVLITGSVVLLGMLVFEQKEGDKRIEQGLG